MEPLGTIVDVAIGNEDFSTLVTAVTMAGQSDVLRGEGPFTVFAPTNSAFNSLDPEVLSMAMADNQLLTNILGYHVVSGRFTAEDLAGMDGQTLPTLYEDNDLTVTVAEDGSILVNGIKVITPDIPATNGIIHVIEAVLVPPME